MLLGKGQVSPQEPCWTVQRAVHGALGLTCAHISKGHKEEAHLVCPTGSCGLGWSMSALLGSGS